MKSLGIIFNFLFFVSFSLVSFAQQYKSTDLLPFEALDREPVPLNLREIRMNIAYPQWAIQGNIEGKVVVGVQVDEKGNYISHKILSSIHPELSELIEAHLMDLQFSPAMKKNQPIRAWVSIPFIFRIVSPLEQKLREAKDMLYLKNRPYSKTLISERP